jgi:putative spermidine/putrescine transport system ATP-binding protein
VVAPPETASLAGEVDSVSFTGDRQRLSVSGAAGRPLLVDVPNSIVVKAGDRVGLMVDPAAIRRLPGEPS